MGPVGGMARLGEIRLNAYYPYKNIVPFIWGGELTRSVGSRYKATEIPASQLPGQTDWRRTSPLSHMNNPSHLLGWKIANCACGGGGRGRERRKRGNCFLLFLPLPPPPFFCPRTAKMRSGDEITVKGFVTAVNRPCLTTTITAPLKLQIVIYIFSICQTSK